jgi:hypothetical protein
MGRPTSAVITLTPSAGFVRSEQTRTSLQGSYLPHLAAVGLATNTFMAENAGLLCLLDCEQRPSRRILRQLAEQHPALKEKGAAVAPIQVAVVTDEAWQSFGEGNAIPFAVGRITGKSTRAVWATVSDALPWLILVDPKGRVTAEGFTLDELNTKLQKFAR